MSSPMIAGALVTTLLGVVICAPTGVGAQATTAAPRPGAAGLGDTVQPRLGNGGYQVRHYRLDLRFTEDLTGYTATSTVQARASHALSRFNLDLKGTEVREVMVGGRPARWSRAGDELQVTPESLLPDGADFTVRVTVRGTVPDAQQATALGTSAIGLVRQGTWVQAMNQPSGAHRIAALADHPAQKAPATITVGAPSGLNSIANGDLTGTWREGPLTVRRFDSREKLATELIQIGVGPFTVVHGKKGLGGVGLRYALPRKQAKQIKPQLDRAVPEAIRFLTERLGAFPLRTYGVYATPLGGELETQSLTLLATDSLTPQGFENNGTDAIIAHEIAHEYFGNSVSPSKWSDLWLSEGHAVYYQMLWSQEHGFRAMDKGMREIYQQANAFLQKEGPIAAPRRAAFTPQDMAPYGQGAYQGGALVLYALRQKVGAAAFERIERAWVHDHRDGNAGTDDFIALASRVTGQDLGPFLRSWLYVGKVPPMPGHPDWRP
ncbi:M1 family metallopeptidase [Microtetraspora malaysiensis]|uniref:M1 family metallopeptidase n=1 Tax=Microtetraspora malaysiensis TaxID=161358 RepID=UPI003D8AD957